MHFDCDFSINLIFFFLFLQVIPHHFRFTNWSHLVFQGYFGLMYKCIFLQFLGSRARGKVGTRIQCISSMISSPPAFFYGERFQIMFIPNESSPERRDTDTVRKETPLNGSPWKDTNNAMLSAKGRELACDKEEVLPSLQQRKEGERRWVEMHHSLLSIKPNTLSFHSWFLMISSWIPPLLLGPSLNNQMGEGGRRLL